MENNRFVIKTALAVALGGFLFGFDAVVISGVNGYINTLFDLTPGQLGFAVASLTLISTVTMFLAGPLSDRYGRRMVLAVGAIAYAISALGSSLAVNYPMFLAFRMLGGVGVGASLVLGPLYIAEISPARLRGRMVSFNQLNIVIAFTVAYFTNLLIRNLSVSGASWVETIGMDTDPWRWMLALEVLPAVLFFGALLFVPESPRWLIMKGREDEGLDILTKANGEAGGKEELDNIKKSLEEEANSPKPSLGEIFKPALRMILMIGIIVGVLQQITGINSVFFYANMIFEQSGIGENASFTQAVFVGIINLVFTLVAMALIDRMGRRPLMIIGTAGVTVSMLFLAFQFGQATYQISDTSVQQLNPEMQTAVAPLIGQSFDNDVSFKQALRDTLGDKVARDNESALISAGIETNPMLVLFGILFFVASFAISLGPVMWVLLSEMFPNRIRGIMISFVAGINSAVSFLVQQVFPWELQNLGTSMTFLIYGIFGLIGLLLVLRLLPETKGKSLEELEAELVKS
ncbi:MAG: sugar porter family MFS transporter [Bacteroidota bacterium]